MTSVVPHFRVRAWLAVFALLAAVRFATIATDAWHWDEVLLSDAVAHGIDLRVHRPHPPGYPLLVETAALVHRLGVEPYRALALVGTAGGILAAAALAAFLAAAGLEPDFACLGGLLYAVVPSVWLFGVRGFSDAPAAAAVFASAALFLSAVSRRDPWFASAGFIISALAAGFRPQSVVALVPLGLWAVVACRRGGRRSLAVLLAGVAAAFAVTLIVWSPAIRGSGGLDLFRQQLFNQVADVRRTSLLSISEILSAPVLHRWFVDPFGLDALAALVWSLALAGAALRPRVSFRVLLLVLPWVFVNVPASTLFAAPRYAAILLAAGAGLAACALAAFAGRSRSVTAVLSTVCLGSCALVALGPVTTASAPSPSVAAIRAATFAPYDQGTLVYDSLLHMHVTRFLPGRAHSEILPDRAVVAGPADVVLTADRRAEGLVEEQVFGHPDALLGRLSFGFLLETRIGVAPVRLSVGTRPAGGEDEVVRYDASIPVAVDAPVDGAALTGSLGVRGWCQLRGGGAVEPVEFRVDGAPARVLALERTPRPDVAAAIPEIGDASRAGWTARLDSSALTAGPHDLKVTFRAFDGRRRIAHPVRFDWSP